LRRAGWCGPGGLVGFTFWGAPTRRGLLPYFAALRELSPADHIDATASQGDTGRPGVAEQMLADAGLEFAGRGKAEVINELPDLDLTVRALAAAGPSWPALHHAGYDQFAKAMRETLRPLYVCNNILSCRAARIRVRAGSADRPGQPRKSAECTICAASARSLTCFWTPPGTSQL